MLAFERPSAISASTSFSRGVSAASRSCRRPTKCATTSGSSAVPPLATRRTASTNASDVHHAVLEQVADAAAAVGEQLARVASPRRTARRSRIAVSGARSRSSSAARSPSSRNVGGMRMSTIAMSGRSRSTACTSASPSPTAATTSMPVVAQQPRQPVAQQREILGDHGAHGSTASITVGPPAGLASRSEPSSASTR